MPSPESNNRRIAKNTVILYVRMAVSMGVAFFTTRLLLGALGVEDFGLAEVTAGVVGMLGFLSGTLTTASSRFFNFELGKGNLAGLRDVFSQTSIIYFAIALAVVLFGETIGFWILQNRVAIPEARFDAVSFLFQLALFSFALNVLSVPFSALLVAHENMRAYAFVTLGESFLKCAGAVLISLVNADALKAYGVLLFSLSLARLLAYVFYGLRKYPECRVTFRWGARRFRELLSFAGWNLFGSVSPIFNGAILNIILNNFFGSAVNAARSVSNQVTGGISGFTTNFLMAANPQIVKYFAQGNLPQMHELIRNALRIGFLLMFWVSLPVLLETDFILNVWLLKVPDYAVIFVRLAIIVGLLETFYPPLATGVQATGKIAVYQAILGIWYCMGLPFSLGFFLFGFGPEFTFVSLMLVSLGGIFIRGFFLRRLTGFPVGVAFVEVFRPIVRAASLSAAGAFALKLGAEFLFDEGWVSFGVIVPGTLAWGAFVILKVALKEGERQMLLEKIKQKIGSRR